MQISAELYEFIIKVVDERVKEIKVTREDFDALKRAVESLAGKVDQLAEAQRKTEERLNELAEAQRRTEERLNQLAEAQRKTEERLNQLAERVDQLAEAQRRTEERLNQLAERVDQLAEAQRRTEERLNQLAEAQIRTEEELRKLVEEHAITRRKVEGLSDTVGYTLENRSYLALPILLKRDFEVEIEGKLLRKYLRLPDGSSMQLNIYGWGNKDKKRVLILGESKVRPSKKEIKRFVKKLKIIEKMEKPDEVISVIVAHDIPLEIEEYLRENNITYYWSYDLEFALSEK